MIAFSRCCIAGVAALAVALALAACADDGARVYKAHGVVQEVQRDFEQVVIAHDDIPGLMPAMTMNFDVTDPALLARLERGQRIDFEVAFDGRSYRVVAAETLGDAEVGDGARLDALARDAELAPGFSLVDQDGRPRTLAELRGKAVLLDFVYTTCPGPCPVQTGIHVEAQRRVPAELRERVWFASITLDPERDTPQALRRYAEARGADLANWSFLTGPESEVVEVLRGYGVSRMPAAGGEIDHLVASFLIDPEGRIAERYIGQSHDAEDLARDLAALARAAAG